MSITVSLLAERPELIGQLVAGYEDWSPGWYGDGGPGDALADLTARARRDGLPLGLVAAEGGVAVGTCALAGESMALTGDFGAWLVGLWVRPSHRRRGIAARLLEAALGEAARLGIAEVRAGTVSAAGVFGHVGWTRLAPIVHEGAETQVFSRRPPDAFRSKRARPRDATPVSEPRVDLDQLAETAVKTAN